MSVLNCISSRFYIDSSQVNFYVSFFANKGYAIENYLSSDNGSVSAKVAGFQFIGNVILVVLVV